MIQRKVVGSFLVVVLTGVGGGAIGWASAPRASARSFPTGANRARAIGGDMSLAQAPVSLRSAVEKDLPPFDRTGPIRLDASNWIQAAELTPSDGGAGDNFGISVAISGSAAVVGSWEHGANGSAYIFTGSGGNWTQSAELNASDGAAGDLFGVSVAIDGSTVVVGAEDHTVNAHIGQGAAYVFTGSGSSWTQAAELTSSDGAAGDAFGANVAISGSTVVVGASLHKVGANAHQGAAYVFTGSGSSWTQAAELTSSDGAANDGFGVSVKTSGSTVVVGSYHHMVGGNASQGAAYVFTGSGSSWTQAAELTSADGAANDEFGSAVAISGSTIAVGAIGHDFNRGAAYVFTPSGSGWTQSAELTAADGAVDDFLGSVGSVAISGSTVVVGSSGHDVNGNLRQGAVYVFNTSGSQIAEFSSSDGAAQDGFGGAVAISGSTIISGADGHVNSNGSLGAAYVDITLPPAGVAPSAPLGLSASDGPITLNWQPPASSGTSPVTSYQVFRFTSNTAATLIATVTAPTTTYVDSNVTPGVTYSYYVQAVNALGTSPPSNVVSITPSSSPAPPPSSCSGYVGNAAFVCALYEDILRRAPDSAGLSGWLAALSSGSSTTQVAYGIVDSLESGTDYLNFIYEGCLGRPVDPAGLATWISAFEAGATVEQVDAGILSSPEFYADSGSSNSGFVNGVYECLLGRPVDPSGLATWTTALANGVSRNQVVYAIDTSTEAYTDDVQGDYESLLNRAADPAGLATWVGALQSGVTDLQVLADIAGSPEFYADATGA